LCRREWSSCVATSRKTIETAAALRLLATKSVKKLVVFAFTARKVTRRTIARAERWIGRNQQISRNRNAGSGPQSLGPLPIPLGRFGMKRNFPEFIAKHHGDIRSRKPGCARSTRERRDGINTRSYRRFPNRRSHHVAQCHSMLRKENNMITPSTRGESVFKGRQRHTWTFHPLSTSMPRNPGLPELTQGVDAASHIKRRPPDARPQRKMKIDP
jgi:hypothetical protein